VLEQKLRVWKRPRGCVSVLVAVCSVDGSQLGRTVCAHSHGWAEIRIRRTPASTRRTRYEAESYEAESRPACSAKSLLEPRVVAHGSEVVVSARVLAEPRKQLDGPPEVGERLVAGFAR
jgi:hypothetical protein